MLEIISNKHLIYKYKIKDFFKHKNNIISLIKKIPLNSLNDKSQRISHTDYNLPRNFQREYFDYVKLNILNDYIEHNTNQWQTSYAISNLWFQCYRKNDFHTWHTHSSTNLTNIFYINLPNQNYKTKFKCFKEEIEIPIEEGYILTIPGYILHSSPINKDMIEKIIISFNSEIVF